MSRLRIAAKADIADLPKNILLTGKGVARVNLSNGELYDRCPIEDYHKQGVEPTDLVGDPIESSVDVFVGLAGEEKPELDLNGVYQVVVDGNGDPIEQTSDEGVDLWLLEKVENVRNQFV